MPRDFGVGVRQPPYGETRPGSNPNCSKFLVNIFLSRIFTKKYFSIFGFDRPKRCGWPIRIRNKRSDRSGDQLLREFQNFSGPGTRLYQSVQNLPSGPWIPEQHRENENFTESFLYSKWVLSLPNPTFYCSSYNSVLPVLKFDVPNVVFRG